MSTGQAVVGAKYPYFFSIFKMVEVSDELKIPWNRVIPRNRSSFRFNLPAMYDIASDRLEVSSQGLLGNTRSQIYR